jgi:hypothetical protein
MEDDNFVRGWEDDITVGFGVIGASDKDEEVGSAFNFYRGRSFLGHDVVTRIPGLPLIHQGSYSTQREV